MTSYADALELNELSKDGAIDLALNQITQPLTIPLDDYIDQYAPWVSKDGLDLTVDMPDWHAVQPYIFDKITTLEMRSV